MKTRALRYYINAFSHADDGFGVLEVVMPKVAYRSFAAAKEAIPAIAEKYRPTRIEVVSR